MRRFLQSIPGLIVDTWRTWLSVIVVLGTVYAVYDPVRKWIAGWLEEQIIAGGSAAPPSFKTLPSHLIAAGVLLAFFLIVVTVYMAVAAYRASVDRSQRDTLLKTFDQSIKAADLICEQHFPPTADPTKKVLSFKEVFAFYENGDCYCLQKMVLTADTNDVHFYEMEIAGEPEAEPASFPEDIQLEVAPAANQSLTYLVSANGPRKKKLVIFFLPFIRAGASDHRTVTTTYYWRGLMRKLFTQREEEFTDEVDSVAPVPDIEYQFWVKPRMGDLVCTQIGKKLPGEKLDRLARNAKGMTGWIYHATNVPVGHETKLRLALR